MRAAKQFETVECPLHLENIRLPARGTALLEDLGKLTANELYDLSLIHIWCLPLRPMRRDFWPGRREMSCLPPGPRS